MRALDRMVFFWVVVLGACGPADPPLAPEPVDEVASAEFGPGVPVAPHHLTARLSTGSSVLLRWSEYSNNEAGFVIERREATAELEVAAGEWHQEAAVPANATSFVDDHLTAGVGYTYRVAAYNFFGVSGWSNLATVNVPHGVLPPAAPRDLTARLDLDGVHLAWIDRSDGQAAFELERAITDGRWIGVTVLEPGETTFVATRVLAGDAIFRVRAINTVGVSAWSNTAAAPLDERYQLELPAAPTELRLTMMERATLLTWRDNSNNESGFEIERLHLSYYQPVWEPVATTRPDATRFIDEERRPGTLAYRVRATNSLGDSPWVTAFFALGGEGGWAK